MAALSRQARYEVDDSRGLHLTLQPQAPGSESCMYLPFVNLLYFFLAARVARTVKRGARDVWSRRVSASEVGTLWSLAHAHVTSVTSHAHVLQFLELMLVILRFLATVATRLR
ncbi:hypothetical protein NDU88_012943 [Pleurodeles waltl]|uniref:Uncharacterized protein n=1 Tax=Pleurodeles waltl TaxID=8319 RepID=A0AAV7R5C1_PLEWA|nr:hypothetical protein NDU88_012943 [Pleurodeles waltl]